MTPLLRRVTFAVLFVAFVGTAEAQEKKPLAVEDLYKFDGPRDAALSPDGKSLVYVRQWIEPSLKRERFSLWLVEGDAKKARAVEKHELDARAPVYSPDGKWIAFLSTRNRPPLWGHVPSAPPQSDTATDIWLMPAAGGDPVPLAGPRRPYGRVFNDGFYGRLAWSPDSKKLAFVADDGKIVTPAAGLPGPVIVARDDQGEGYTGWGTAQVWVAHITQDKPDFDDGLATKIERLTDDDVWYGDPNWSPDGKTVAVHANRTKDRESVRFSINKNFDIWLIDVATKKLTQATSGPGPEVSPRFSPDGTKIACLSCPRKGTHRDEFNLAVIDLSGAKPETRVPFNHHDATKDGTGYPRPMFPLPVECWESNTHLICTAEAGADNEMVRIDTATGRGGLYMFKGGPNAKSPGERVMRRGHLTPGNTFLNERFVAEQKVISWKSDEFTIEGLLTLPPAGVAKPPYKLFVHPHGGPHGRQTPGFDFTVQLFASHGYAVLQPNFRGSTGYGQKFIDADRGDFGGGDMRDIMRGVDKLIEDKIADKDRLFVYGISYGGYMTSWLVGQTDRFRAAVAQNAVTDLNMMWHLSDLQSWTEWEFGGKPWEQPEKYRKHSPLTYADKVKTPTLILHARDDRRCPLPMGQAFHQALKARGVPTGLVIYADEGHGIKQPRHREDVLRRVLEWFEKYDKYDKK